MSMNYTKIILTIGYSNHLDIDEVKREIEEALNCVHFILLDITASDIEFTPVEMDVNGD